MKSDIHTFLTRKTRTVKQSCAFGIDGVENKEEEAYLFVEKEEDGAAIVYVRVRQDG